MTLHRTLAGATACMLATVAGADPASDSCRFLDIVGGNKRGAVEPLFADLADRWPEQSRTNAVTTLKTLLQELEFDGGNVYVVSQPGADYEEHILAIRLKTGELAAGRLTYEWTPDGLRLTGMNFKRRMSEMLPVGGPFLVGPLDCPAA